jgi:NAD-dependent deacetylase
MARIFILTGAGVSAESGVDTFRDAGGVWARYDVRDVATPEGFRRNPDLVHDFYTMRRRGLETVKPNAAHEALGRLQNHLAGQGEVFLCTQNVDDLHERGGALQVHHMHSELNRDRCTLCGDVRAKTKDLSRRTVCPSCGRTGTTRPDVVWFGEMPYGLDLIAEKLRQAELFVSIGTSGAVYPAAGLVAEARTLGLRTVELNLEPSENAPLFDEARYGKASACVPAWVEDVIMKGL